MKTKELSEVKFGHAPNLVTKASQLSPKIALKLVCFTNLATARAILAKEGR